ncbi:MAG TPA: RagB/SusD family nutrient uptake outer membrane protein, partial [Chitinophagaceae bacterium]|nr:RagB/SusD family nutrient uptake outer membrane protein [Chitinophagaceae bacterium]
CEGKRWHDIHRNAVDPNFSTGGIPAKYVNASQGAALYNCGGAINASQAAIPYADFKFIWPIPSTEVIQNPVIEQNPGY